MAKLKLRVNDVRVESFGTDAGEAPRGTVAGHQSGEFTCFLTCPATCDTCPPGCGPTRAHTCEGYTCTENLPHCYG